MKMSLINWLRGEETAVSDSERFIQLIKVNNNLEEKLATMDKALKK